MSPIRSNRFKLNLRPSLLVAALCTASVMLSMPVQAAEKTPFRADIEGPVTAIKGDTLTVLGQTVKVNSATAFDDEIKAGVSALRVGQTIEVDGVSDAKGVITATRIDLEDDQDPYKLRGTVRDLDKNKRTFKVGDATVSYANVVPKEGRVLLENGAQVEVRLNRTAEANVWQATRLKTVSEHMGGKGEKGVSAEIEGKVTDITKSGNHITGLVVGGVKVDVRGMQIPAGIEKGSKLEVKGHYKDGVLSARKLDKETWLGSDEGQLQLEGRIVSVDAAGQTFKLHGVTVDFRGSRIDDGRTAAALVPGAKVEVQGTLARDGKTLVAKVIDID